MSLCAFIVKNLEGRKLAGWSQRREFTSRAEDGPLVGGGVWAHSAFGESLFHGCCGSGGAPVTDFAGIYW